MIDKNDELLLKNISEINGISGFENEVAAYIKEQIKDDVDEISFDNLGSLIAYQKGNKDQPLVMFCAHMDEVGFVVKNIEDSGLILIHNIGGWYNHIILNQMYVIKTRDNKKYFAISGAQPPHGMSKEAASKVLDLKDMYLDLGVENKQMVLDLGINIGDSVTPYQKFMVMNDNKTLLGKAWDDRIGCAMLIKALKNFRAKHHDCNVCYAFSVQEEVGLRGAKTLSNKVKPDIAFAIDVTFSYDLPNSVKMDAKLGNGVALSIMDGSVIAHRGLLNFVSNLAKKHNIKYCYDILSAGGTDSGAIHTSNDGVINMTLSLPCRYFHSHVSLIHYDDFVNGVKLIEEIISAVNSDVLVDLKKSKYE